MVRHQVHDHRGESSTLNVLSLLRIVYKLGSDDSN